VVGRRVQEVRYWDQDIFAEEPQRWDYDDWHHAVMGVDLLTDHGPMCVLWTSTFYPYGVEVFQTPFSQHESGSGPYDASGSDRWRDRLNSPVEHVQTFWENLKFGPRYADSVQVSKAYTVDVPVALRIDFAAGPVWMVADIPEYPAMDKVFVPGDEIMVVFTGERMRQIGFPDSEFLTVRRS
jgi:hypothetical protein